MAKNKNKSKNTETASDDIRKMVNTTAEDKKKLQPTTSQKNRGTSSNQASEELLYGKENFILIGVGAALVIIGLMLMAGGGQELNEWNADEVYSTRRIVIAPLFILAGLITELVAIFKKKAVA